MISKFKNFAFYFAASFFAAAAFFIFVNGAHGANLSSLRIGPSSGAFTVGGTFNVSVFLETAGESINAVDTYILFPPDKLQVVSPSAGKSIIEIWTAQPSYDNQNGRIHFQGGIPSPGIKTENAVISTITFRVKSTGKAVIRFGDETKVFLNDGLGTNVLGEAKQAIYDLVLPPPAGPIVASPSHPNQSSWYNSASAILNWTADQNLEGYSYVLNTSPIDLPDDISEGTKNEVIYRNLPSGIHYFHIKALRESSWGGVTHFALNIDAAPPAGFPIEVVPGTRSSRKNVVISFSTTDRDSGIEHYEIKIVKLNDTHEAEDEESFFIEASSPFVTTLELGNYEVTVRAYDNAGNFTEAKTKLEIVRQFFEIVSGIKLRVGEFFVIPLLWLFILSSILIAVLAYAAWRTWSWHSRVHSKLLEGALNDPVISKRLEQLKGKRMEYPTGLPKSLVILFAIGIALTAMFGSVKAEEVRLTPPIITVISERISNEEMFYVGGKSDVEDSAIVIYFQNTQTSETFSEVIYTSKRGDWFYSHNKALPSGRYLVWAQTKIGDSLSPPSPQNEITVTRTAVSLGARRLSFESIYLILALLMGSVAFGLAVFIVYHYAHGRRKKGALAREIEGAERSLQEGFEVLYRDVLKELEHLRKTKSSKERVEEEEKILEDLKIIKEHIGKEIADVELEFKGHGHG
ncbi:MAG: hypothetical protein HYT12_04280 [Candidatus Liptonbacteria bacterium]|nr:hypothetical protein [Candidatus Liptonbacteria bacterium]